MKKFIKLMAAIMLISISADVFVIAAEESDSFSADQHHHHHGSPRASFIPEKILNPDDSEYEAPEAVQDYTGLYYAEIAEIPELNHATLKLILNIREDGLFNLAYYFDMLPPNVGQRFYVNEAGEIEAVDAPYKDLVLMTGALREGEGGLGSGLIGETISPIVLLDEQGEPAELYTYMTMAYGLREQYVNARVYQSVGLVIADDVVAVDGNHLLGFETEEPLVFQFESVEDHADEFLVETPVFELLQYNFDTHLIDHNDFDMSYETTNEFVQKVLAMHLERNLSFPADSEAVLLEPENVALDESLEADPVKYALLINNQILYAHDGTKLYVTDDFEVEGEQYSSSNWDTN